jgi:hypothetical protein
MMRQHRIRTRKGATMGRPYLVLALGLILALGSVGGLIHIGTGDSGVDNHSIFFVEGEGQCQTRDFVVGTGTLLDKPKGNRREPAEIAFSSDCRALKITSSHEFKEIHNATGIDLGVSSFCGVTRRLLSSPKSDNEIGSRYVYRITAHNATSDCRYTVTIPGLLKRLSFSTYLLDINVGPNAEAVGLFNAPDYYSEITSQSRLGYNASYVHRYRIIIRSTSLDYWERVLTIILSAMIGVGATVVFEVIVHGLAPPRSLGHS